MKYTNIVTTVAFGKATGAVNVGATLPTIKKGDILIIDADSGTVLTGAANTVTNHPRIAIASCVVDGQPIISSVLHGDALSDVEAYMAQKARKIGNLVIGYKAGVSAEAIPVYSEDTEFSIGVIVSTKTRLHPNKQYRKEVAAVGLGGYSVASQLCAQLSDQSDNNPDLPANFPVVGAVTVEGTSAAVATTSVTAVQGSRVLNGTVGALAVGDIIALNGGSGADDGSGEDITGKGGVFKIVEVGATSVVLDRKYWGVTVSATSVYKYSTQVSFGIVLYPKAITQDNPVDQYNQVGKIQVALSETFGDLTPVVETAAVLGEGYGWQLYDTEARCMGNIGFTDRRDPMRQGYVFQADEAGKYDQMAIASEKSFNTGNSSKSYAAGGIIVAFNTAASTQRAAVSAILTPWLASGGVTAAW